MTPMEVAVRCLNAHGGKPDSMLDGMIALIVEDEFLIAMEIEQICRRANCADVIVRNRPEDVEPADLKSCQVAILNGMTAGHAGLDLARKLRDHSVATVFATGLSSQEDLLGDFPEIPVVTKPFREVDLREAIERAVGQMDRKTDGR